MLQFKVHGQLPLRGVMVEETESRMGASNCFTIYGGNRSVMNASNSSKEIYIFSLVWCDIYFNVSEMLQVLGGALYDTVVLFNIVIQK